jgi:MerR family mercuric resistance operon transcriptional regulator
LIALDSTDDRPRVRELAAARVQALDMKIVELRRARDALHNLARECSRGGAGPCPILSSFETGPSPPRRLPDPRPGTIKRPTANS